MTGRGVGPPKKVPRSGIPLPTTGNTTTNSRPALTRTDSRLVDSSGGTGQCGSDTWRRRRRSTPSGWRYADDWRAVFRRGALDALRCAAREIHDPNAWAVLDELADRYSVDYDLAGG